MCLLCKTILKVSYLIIILWIALEKREYFDFNHSLGCVYPNLYIFRLLGWVYRFSLLICYPCSSNFVFHETWRQSKYLTYGTIMMIKPTGTLIKKENIWPKEILNKKIWKKIKKSWNFVSLTNLRHTCINITKDNNLFHYLDTLNPISFYLLYLHCHWSQTRPWQLLWF